MRRPAVAIFCLTSTVCLAPAFGASPTQVALDGELAARDSRSGVPALDLDAMATGRKHLGTARISSLVTAPSAVHGLLEAPVSDTRKLAQNDESCYTLRSYGFTRDDPRSDAMQASSYSTCQPSAKVRMKTAGALGSR